MQRWLLTDADGNDLGEVEAQTRALAVEKARKLLGDSQGFDLAKAPETGMDTLKGLLEL